MESQISRMYQIATGLRLMTGSFAVPTADRKEVTREAGIRILVAAGRARDVAERVVDLQMTATHELAERAVALREACDKFTDAFAEAMRIDEEWETNHS